MDEKQFPQSCSESGKREEEERRKRSAGVNQSRRDSSHDSAKQSDMESSAVQRSKRKRQHVQYDKNEVIGKLKIIPLLV